MFLFGFERVDWRSTVVDDFCCIETTGGTSVVMVGSTFVGSWAGGLFKFKLALFGTADDFGAGVSRGCEKFDMVVGDLKMSA